MLKLNTTDFDEKVLKSTGLTVVDFYADWCSPCRGLVPILNDLEKSNPEVKFVKVDVDQEQDLSARYGISSIPTLLFFKDGKKVQQLVGMASKESILQVIKQNR